MTQNVAYRIEFEEAMSFDGKPCWRATPVVRLDTETGYTTRRLPWVEEVSRRQANERAAHAATSWLAENQAADSTVAPALAQAARDPLETTVKRQSGMDRYSVELQRLGETGDGGQRQWTAEPVVRVANAGSTTSERLGCVFASTENEVRALALSAAERWIHDQLISEASADT